MDRIVESKRSVNLMNKSNTVTCSFTMDRDTLDAIEKVQSKLNASTPTNSVARHSDESLLSLLEHSDRQYHDGKAMNMRDTIMDARKQHGYKCGHEIFRSNQFL